VQLCDSFFRVSCEDSSELATSAKRSPQLKGKCAAPSTLLRTKHERHAVGKVSNLEKHYKASISAMGRRRRWNGAKFKVSEKPKRSKSPKEGCF